MRATFTTVNLPDVNTATYEPANQSAELAKYLRLDKAKLVTAAIFDHTNGAASGTSERLNGSANEKFGIARSISVAAGDVISTEVYAKYVDPNSANWSGALTSLIGQIATGTVGVVVDGANYNNAINPFPYPGAPAHTPSGTGPKAYLNWLVFDKNWTLDLSKSGYMQMSTAGKEAGTDVAHERLFSPTINITEPGYVYVYLSNEETTPVDVYFDDLKVTQVKTPIVQVEDYYPFGLTFNSYQRDSSMPDQYLYNGKELQDELSLGWLDYGARMYMPELGRWGVVDREAARFVDLSPYNYVDNDPLRNTDPDGNFIIYGKFKKETKEALRYLKENSPSARSDIRRLRWSFKFTKISGEVGGAPQSAYDPRKISYKPYKATTNSKGDVQSPAVMLAHELHHSAESLRDRSLIDPNSPKNQEKDIKTGAKAVEEDATKHEGKVVDELNQNHKDGSPEGKRSNYGDSGDEVKVNSPTSNDPVSNYSDQTKSRIKTVEEKERKRSN